MEAGNRCFDQRVPEESNRKIVDHISDINLTYSDIAREYLLSEGLRPDRVIKTGSPMFEVLMQYLPKIEKSRILDNLHLETGKYFVVSSHREENINSEKNFYNLVKILNDVAEKYDYPVIVSTHPRTRKMVEQKGIQFHKNIQLMKPMGLSDYNKLQIHAFAVLSDSGTISEESSILNFRALNIREAHERPEAMEEASVMMVGLNPERVMQGLAQLQYQYIDGERNFRPVYDYSMLNIDNDDKVNAFIRVKGLDDADYINSHYLIFCTKNGVIKKTSLEAYSRPRQNGVNAITIREDDQVIQVRLTDGNSEVIMANRNGRAIRFHESKVREMGRTATGVRGMMLDEDGEDEVVGMLAINSASVSTTIFSPNIFFKVSSRLSLGETLMIKEVLVLSAAEATSMDDSIGEHFPALALVRSGLMGSYRQCSVE